MKKTIKKTDKKGRTEEWSWEETPELTEWIKKNNAPKVKPRPIRPTT
tara:strand:+ start:154 stop:294 length:141 start_codon:yes stop_codon:yes gene_type:complete